MSQEIVKERWESTKCHWCGGFRTFDSYWSFSIPLTDCGCVHGVCDNRPGSGGVCQSWSCKEGYTGKFCDRTSKNCGPSGLSQYCHQNAVCSLNDTARSVFLEHAFRWACCHCIDIHWLWGCHPAAVHVSLCTCCTELLKWCSQPATLEIRLLLACKAQTVVLLPAVLRRGCTIFCADIFKVYLHGWIWRWWVFLPAHWSVQPARTRRLFPECKWGWTIEVCRKSTEQSEQRPRTQICWALVLCLSFLICKVGVVTATSRQSL